MSLTEITAVADQFQLPTKVADARELGAGNINDTFLVGLVADEEKIILQRINARVFRHPELIMENLCTVTEHMRNRMSHEINRSGRWEVVRIFPSRNGRHFVIDSQGTFWRAVSFIDKATSYEIVKNTGHAAEAGRALGRFHYLVNDLNPQSLHDTLPGFHITPEYIDHYDEAARSCADLNKPDAVRYCARFVDGRRQWVSVLEDAKKENLLMLRTIHGDPKISNIMIDDVSGRAVSIIDLDTVKPGLIHYDIGDCLRSCCNPLGEETGAIDKVYFDIELCRAILEGYFVEAGGFLSDNDYRYIYDAVRLITFELGLRFFTDYLADNVYFKVGYREHNLIRAMVQFKLTESIEAQETAIRKLVSDLRSSMMMAS